MIRRASFVVLVVWFGAAGWAAEDSPPKEVVAVEVAMEEAIARAEPSVACVIVSRSSVYQNWFGESPSPDQPGRLGDFSPATAVLRAPPGDQDQVREQKDELARRLVTRRDDPRVDRAFKKRFDLSDLEYVPESFGSGVVVDERGLVLTNYHVVRDARKIFVRLPEGGAYADIHAADPRSDLAVLRLLTPAMALRAVRLGDGGHVRKGQLVLSVANPFAAGFRDGSPSASWGIVSNVRRRLPTKPLARETDRAQLTLHHYGTLLQTDARLNAGCSGGALIDLKGELVGLTTAVAALTGMETAGGFAVPMDEDMKAIVRVLMEGREVEYGFLGVTFDAGPQFGGAIQFRDVYANSPAERAGLRRGDTLVEVNGHPVRENDDLFLNIGRHLAGSEVRLKLRSPGGGERPAVVRLAKLYQPGERIIASNRPKPVHGLRVDYASVLVQRDRSLSVIPEGVFVSDVQAGSPADNAHLQNTMVVAVNGRPVGDPETFYREVARAEGSGAPLELTVTGVDGGGERRVRLD